MKFTVYLDVCDTCGELDDWFVGAEYGVDPKSKAAILHGIRDKFGTCGCSK